MCFWLQEAERSWAEGNPRKRPARGSARRRRDRQGRRGRSRAGRLGSAATAPSAGPAEPSAAATAGRGGQASGSRPRRAAGGPGSGTHRLRRPSGDRRGCCRAGLAGPRGGGRAGGPNRNGGVRGCGVQIRGADRAEPSRAGQEEPGTGSGIAEGAPGHDWIARTVVNKLVVTALRLLGPRRRGRPRWFERFKVAYENDLGNKLRVFFLPVAE